MEDYKDSRSEMLLGKQGVGSLRSKRVAVFGAGGVGGAAIEALARSSIGTIDIFDNDVFSESNLNRQILSSIEVIGKEKVEVAKSRIASIDPLIKVNVHKMFYLPQERENIDFREFDYVIDAIDTLTAKVDLALACLEANVPLISALGCGNRLDPKKLIVTDIFKTEGDPLAKSFRKALREKGIKKLKVVYSTEQPLKPINQLEDEVTKRHSPGSMVFVPNAAGLILAFEVVNTFLGN